MNPRLSLPLRVPQAQSFGFEEALQIRHILMIADEDGSKQTRDSVGISGHGRDSTPMNAGFQNRVLVPVDRKASRKRPSNTADRVCWIMQVYLLYSALKNRMSGD